MKLAFVLSVLALAAATSAFTLQCDSPNAISFDGTLTSGQWTLVDIHTNPAAGVSLFNAFAAGYPNYSFNSGSVNVDVMLEIGQALDTTWWLEITGIAYGGENGNNAELGLDYRCNAVTEENGGLVGRDCSGTLSLDPLGANHVLPVTGKAIGNNIELTLYSKYDLRYELFAWIQYSPLFDQNTVVSGDINGKLECRENCIPECDENGAGPTGSCFDDGCGGVCPCPEGTFCNGEICTMAPTECIEEGIVWDPTECGTYGLGELSASNSIILPNSYAAGPVMLTWAAPSGDEGVFDGAYFDYCPDGTFAIGGEVILNEGDANEETCEIAYSCNTVTYDNQDPEFVRASDCSGMITCPDSGVISLGGKSNGVSEFEIHSKWGVTKGSGWVEYLAYTEEGGIESGGWAHGDINFTFVCQWSGETGNGSGSEIP